MKTPEHLTTMLEKSRPRQETESGQESQMANFARQESQALTSTVEQTADHDSYTRRGMLAFAFRAATGMCVTMGQWGLLEAQGPRAEKAIPPETKQAAEKLRQELVSPEFQGTRWRFEQLFGTITSYHQSLLKTADQSLEDITLDEKGLPAKFRWLSNVKEMTIEQKYTFLHKFHSRFFDRERLDQQIVAKDKKPNFVKFPTDRLPDGRTLEEFLVANIDPQILAQADNISCVAGEKALTKTNQTEARRVAVTLNTGLEKMLNGNFKSHVLLFYFPETMRTVQGQQTLLDTLRHELGHLFSSQTARNLTLAERMQFDIENAELLADPTRPKSWYVDENLAKELELRLKKDRKLIKSLPQIKTSTEQASKLHRSHELWAEMNEWYDSPAPAQHDQLTPRMRQHVEKWRQRIGVPIKPQQ